MRKITTNECRFLTSRQAAEYLGISIRTLEKGRSFGSGPRYRKFGRNVRYTTDDLDKWAKAYSFEATSDYDFPCKGRPGKR